MVRCESFSHTGAKVMSVTTPITSITNTAIVNERYIIFTEPFGAMSVELERINQSANGTVSPSIG
jgi:hypothetical protein